MLVVYSLYMARANPMKFAPESVFDPEYGVECHYEVYGDDSTDNYDRVLREESEFYGGIQGVQEYLDSLMQTEVFNILQAESDGYADSEEVRELEFKYQLSGGFGDWHWRIEYEQRHDCLVFMLGHDD